MKTTATIETSASRQGGRCEPRVTPRRRLRIGKALVAAAGVAGLLTVSVSPAEAQQPPAVTFGNEPPIAREGEVVRPDAGGGVITELLNVNEPGKLAFPYGLARLANGDLLIANQQGPQIIRRAADGTVTVVAGNGSAGTPTSGGVAVDQPLSSPSAVAVDAAGNIYLASGTLVFRVDAGGIITLFSSHGGTRVRDLTFDIQGNLYVSDNSDFVG